MALNKNESNCSNVQLAEESRGEGTINPPTAKSTENSISLPMTDQPNETSIGQMKTSIDFEVQCKTLSRDPLSFPLYHIIPGPRKNRYYFQITITRKSFGSLPGIVVHGLPVYVAEVEASSPLADVLRKGDRILAVNDKPPRSTEECANQLKYNNLKIHIERSYEKTAYEEEQKKNTVELLAVPATPKAQHRRSEDDETIDRRFEKLPNDVQRILQTKKEQLDEDLAHVSHQTADRNDNAGTKSVRVRLASKIIQKEIHSDIPQSRTRELRKAPK
ncbi:PDZ/DHR/GLGF domain protein [Trichuris suis]|nr:PDZ/DHR/GLGF domain protein [Trichuris suis]